MPARFRNPPGSAERSGSLADYAAFFARRAMTAYRRPRVPEGHIVPRDEALAQLAAHPANSITWLGHSAFFLRLGTTGILLDPYLSLVAGPRYLGPIRFASAKLQPVDLGKIDAVLISHSHYDHLDASTLRSLPRRESITAIVPLGLDRLLRSFGYSRVVELDWQGSIAVHDVKVTALPAIHWSKRGVADENATLWCGYLIEDEHHRVYFSGDTGYGPIFKEIGQQYGPIDLALVPIGAYEPASIMKPIHTTPEEAVEIARDMRGAQVVGMHWGTIVLTDEDPWEPPQRFRAAARAAGYGEDATWLMRLGETRPLGK